jgi:hypothetical protein
LTLSARLQGVHANGQGEHDTAVDRALGIA